MNMRLRVNENQRIFFEGLNPRINRAPKGAGLIPDPESPAQTGLGRRLITAEIFAEAGKDVVLERGHDRYFPV